MSDRRAEQIERMKQTIQRMNEVERDLSHPYVRPKDAATLILVDRSGPAPKVLLGKRHHASQVHARDVTFFPAGASTRSTASCRLECRCMSRWNSS